MKPLIFLGWRGGGEGGKGFLYGIIIHGATGAVTT